MFLEQSSAKLDMDNLSLFDDLESGSLTQVTMDKAMAAAGDKTGLVGLQQAERLLAPHADVVMTAVQRIEEEMSSEKSLSKEVARRLKQLDVKVRGQHESIQTEL